MFRSSKTHTKMGINHAEQSLNLLKSSMMSTRRWNLAAMQPGILAKNRPYA